MIAGFLAEMRLPVVQAPMAGAQDRRLAIAVSHAGGLGSVPCAMLSPEALQLELADLAAHGSAPYCANFFCHVQPTENAAREGIWRRLLQPYYREFDIADDSDVKAAVRRPFDHASADLVEQYKPAVVSFHFGLPSPALVERVKASGATIMATATTVAEAQWLVAHGADVIIAQGLEAGGHRGSFLSDDLSVQMGTFALVPQVARSVAVPVIAAGGIADVHGVPAALRLGAVAVQVGTAYLLADEATTSAVHRAALLGEGATHTTVTNVFSGRPARGIVNRLIRELGAIRADVPAFPLAAAALAPLRAKAERQGADDFSPLWAGQNVSGCRRAGAATITQELAG